MTPSRNELLTRITHAYARLSEIDPERYTEKHCRAQLLASRKIDNDNALRGLVLSVEGLLKRKLDRAEQE